MGPQELITTALLAGDPTMDPDVVDERSRDLYDRFVRRLRAHAAGPEAAPGTAPAPDPELSEMAGELLRTLPPARVETARSIFRIRWIDTPHA